MKTYDIKSMTPAELQAEIKPFCLSQYRVQQIYNWLHTRGAETYEEMSNLPKELRTELMDRYPILGCDIVTKQVSRVDGTEKYLFSLHDGQLIESVLMSYKYGYTLCLSTQVGCRMGCEFCATSKGGLIRNLLPSEMLAQIHSTQKEMGIRVSHIVLMGMGEPLDNYKNVLRFIELVSNPDGLNIGMRNISLSTCGIVPAVYMLLERHLQLTLSVSLHAPNNEIRSKIMPVNRRYPIEELLQACKIYSESTSRRVSFEYAMLEGINDSRDCADQLAGRLKGMLCHVNLIPLNVVAESGYKRSTDINIKDFKEILLKNGINVTIRRSLGADINASCGQLRSRHI